MSGRGGCRGRRGMFIKVRGRGGRQNLRGRNNQNNRQELKFCPRGTGPDRQTSTFTKLKGYIILKIQG